VERGKLGRVGEKKRQKRGATAGPTKKGFFERSNTPEQAVLGGIGAVKGEKVNENGKQNEIPGAGRCPPPNTRFLA